MTIRVAAIVLFIVVSIFIIAQSLKIVLLEKELDKHWMVITQQQKELNEFRAIATPKSKVEMFMRQVEAIKKESNKQ